MHKKLRPARHEDPTERVPMKLGYGRVSTPDQDLAVQIAALEKFSCDHIFREKVSAVDAKRPQFRLMKKFAEPGDIIVVHAFSRIYRDVKLFLGFVDEMKAKGIVSITSLTEPHVNPYTTSGRMMASILASIDEHERRRASDRTSMAMQLKKSQGQYIGRPRVISDRVSARMKAEYVKSSIAVIARKYGVSTSTVWKHVK